MVGIFDPQTIQGSSLRSETFVRQPSEKVSSRALGQLAETATRAYGAVQVDKAADRVGQIQDTFLSELSAQREDKATVDQLQNEQAKLQTEDPSQRAAFDNYQSKLNTLNAAIDSRRISPTEALSRIEVEKRKALSQAPMFSREISSLTGSSGTTFDAETSQLIKERNIVREGILNAGGDPDRPNAALIWKRGQALDFQATMLANEGKLEGVQAQRVLQDSIANSISFQEDVILGEVEKAGGFSQLTASMSTDLRRTIQPFLGDNAINVVERIIASNPNIDSSLVSPEIKDRMALRISSSATVLDQQLSGEIPQGTYENLISVERSNAELKMAKDAPDLYHLVANMRGIAKDTLAGTGVSEVLADGFQAYAEANGLGDLNGMTKESLENKGITDPIEVQRQMGKRLDQIIEEISSNEALSPTYVKASHDVIINNAKAINLNPQEFNPAIYDSVLKAASNKRYVEQMQALDPVSQKEFRTQVGTMIRSYTTEAIIPDIAVQMTKDIVLPSFARSGISVKLRDVISPSVDPVTGVLKFLPKKGLKTVEEEQKVLREAQRLTRMYSTRSALSLQAMENLGGLDSKQAAQFSTVIYGDALQGIGLPAVSETGDITVQERSPFAVSPL